MTSGRPDKGGSVHTKAGTHQYRIIYLPLTAIIGFSVLELVMTRNHRLASGRIVMMITQGPLVCGSYTPVTIIRKIDSNVFPFVNGSVVLLTQSKFCFKGYDGIRCRSPRGDFRREIYLSLRCLEAFVPLGKWVSHPEQLRCLSSGRQSPGIYTSRSCMTGAEQ
jgi:hypothetical protein